LPLTRSICALPRCSSGMTQCSTTIGLECIVAKRRELPYKLGRSPDWIKIKNAPAATTKCDGEAPTSPADGPRQHGPAKRASPDRLLPERRVLRSGYGTTATAFRVCLAT
jgi:hypothetical protein